MEQNESFTFTENEEQTEVFYLDNSNANLFLEGNASFNEFILLEEQLIDNVVEISSENVVSVVSSATTTNSDDGSEKIDQDNIEQNYQIIEPSIPENDAVEPTGSTATRKTRKRKQKTTVETNPGKKKKNTPKPPSHRKKNRNRRGNAKPDSWFRNMQHNRRIHGQEYESRDGTIIPEKTARYMEKCPCIYKCHENFDEEAQKSLFQEYYASGKSPVMISQNIFEDTIARSRPRKNVASKVKTKSRSYYLPRRPGLEKVRVCQRFFCFIFQISFRTIDRIMEQKTPNGFIIPKPHGLTGVKPKNATSDDQLAVVKNHINSFPRIPSHYCRKSTTRLYLSPELNISLLYRLYVEHCTNSLNIEPVKENVYRRVFLEFEPQLSFYHPKKDLCTLCELMKDSSITRSEECILCHAQHKQFKHQSLEQKRIDMANTAEWHRCITFDMEANLQVPYAGDSQIYYKRKLNVFNFTIYDNATNGICFLYDECNGGKTCNEVSSCLQYYLLNELPPSITHVTTYSDTCAAQNRNSFFLSMMILTVNQHPTLQEININYLESGHTYLECDSMHAAIERKLRSRKVYTPAQLSTIMEEARIRPKPYKVKLMEYSDFYNFKSCPVITTLTKDANKDKVLWLKVKRFRVVKGSTSVKYSYDYTSDFKEIPILLRPSKTHQRRKTPSPPKRAGLKKFSTMEDIKTFSPLKVYKEPLKISVAKKRDLMDLLKTGVIPQYYASFYTSLQDDPKIKDAAVFQDNLLEEIEIEEIFFGETE